jgi:hypothetical protein
VPDALTGPLVTSGIYTDLSNGVFYATFRSGSVASTVQEQLVFTRVSAAGDAVFMADTAGTASDSGSPSVRFLSVAGDVGDNLHGAFVMNNPEGVAQGVYCYDYTGLFEGVAAQNLTADVTPGNFLWPAPEGGLVLFQSLATTTDLGCGALTVPAAGGIALGEFTGGGVCMWSKLLALPTASVKAKNFRIGQDGSLLAAVVYSGTIDFGLGSLTSTGTLALALAKFDSGGNALWARSFSAAGSSFVVGSVGANADGIIFLTGGYAGAVNLGLGALSASDDTFVAVFNSDGSLRWQKTVVVGSQATLIAGAGPCGLSVATNSATVDFGSGPIGGANSIGVATLGL